MGFPYLYERKKYFLNTRKKGILRPLKETFVKLFLNVSSNSIKNFSKKLICDIFVN